MYAVGITTIKLPSGKKYDTCYGITRSSRKLKGLSVDSWIDECKDMLRNFTKVVIIPHNEIDYSWYGMIASELGDLMNELSTFDLTSYARRNGLL